MSFWIPELTLGSSTLLPIHAEHAALAVNEFLTCQAIEILHSQNFIAIIQTGLQTDTEK